MNKDLPIVLGITGASGAIYGYRILEFLLQNGYKVDLVLSDNSLKVAAAELSFHLPQSNLLDKAQLILNQINSEAYSANLQIWDHTNVAAAISSGSYKTQGMIIAPCSMGTIGNIASGTSNNLITRAADVIIKERRKLVLVARETPLSTIHLRNMLALSESGVVVLPAAPGFYHQPQSIDDLVNFIVGKTLDVFGVENSSFKRWLGERYNELKQ